MTGARFVGLGAMLDQRREDRGDYRTVWRVLQDVAGSNIACLLPPILESDELLFDGHVCAYCLGSGKVIAGSPCECCRGLGQLRISPEPGSILPFIKSVPAAADRLTGYRVPGLWYVQQSADDELLTPATPLQQTAKGSTLPPAGFGYGFNVSGLIYIGGHL